MRITLLSGSLVATGLCSICLATERKPQAFGPEDLQVFPQIFHVDSNNTSVIFVQNPGTTQIEVGLEFFAQNGDLACAPGADCPVASQLIPPLGTVQFSHMPEPFVGSASVFCTGPCVATANWSFRIGASQSFQVGALPQLFSLRSRKWAAPVPPVGSTSLYGFAIYNISLEPASCDVVFYDQGGQQRGHDTVSVPGNGQVAQFAESISSGFSGNAVVTCDQDVIATGLIQDLSNGFPTSLNYVRVE